MRVVLTAWRPTSTRSGSTVGYLDCRLPDLGISLHEVALKRTGDGLYAVLPLIPKTARRKMRLRSDGRPMYDPAVTFLNAADLDIFSAAVVAAVIAAHPEVKR